MALQDITLLIHTEDERLLSNALSKIEQSPLRSQIASVYIHSKGYTCWTIDSVFQRITKIPNKDYIILSTADRASKSIVDLIAKVKTNKVLIIDEKINSIPITQWDLQQEYLLSDTKELLQLNLDTKYETIKWFLSDVISQKTTHQFELDAVLDSNRYLQKINHPLFRERVIHIDGGLGDHIMAYPLVEQIASEVYVSCVYPFTMSHLKVKGVIDWSDDLFGGYARSVYQYGNSHESPSITDAFFGMYGTSKLSSKFKYTGPVTPFTKSVEKPIALLSISAAKINNVTSNKDWPEIRWLKLIHELKQLGYYVIQVGSYKDTQLPKTYSEKYPDHIECKGGVDDKFLDKSIPELAGLIESADLWISVDTFFHHFASAIKPEVGVCLTPFYNSHAKHKRVTYIEKDSGKNYYDRRWWLDLQQPERKDCMNLIQVEDVVDVVNSLSSKYIVNVIAGSEEDNCSNWRAYMPFNRETNLIQYNVIDFGKETFNLDRDYKADLVIFNRPVINFLEYIKLLRNQNVKVAVDYDDMFPYVKTTEHVFVPAYTEMIQILQEVDYVITTNEKMKYYFEQHTTKPVLIYPNVVHKKYINFDNKTPENRITLGWYGSRGHMRNVQPMKDALLRILDEYDNVYFKIQTDNVDIVNEFYHDKTLICTYNSRFEKFIEDISDVDINLAPLEETYINLGKSDIRVQLSAARGVPSIATNFSEYKKFASLNQGAVLVENTTNSWYNAIKYLIDNPDELNQLKQNAIKTIDTYYNYDVWSQVKDESIIELIND